MTSEKIQAVAMALRSHDAISFGINHKLADLTSADWTAMDAETRKLADMYVDAILNAKFAATGTLKLMIRADANRKA